jgi:hypothetical protein
MARPMRPAVLGDEEPVVVEFTGSSRHDVPSCVHVLRATFPL